MTELSSGETSLAGELGVGAGAASNVFAVCEEEWAFEAEFLEEWEDESEGSSAGVDSGCASEAGGVADAESAFGGAAPAFEALDVFAAAGCEVLGAALAGGFAGEFGCPAMGAAGCAA